MEFNIQQRLHEKNHVCKQVVQKNSFKVYVMISISSLQGTLKEHLGRNSLSNEPRLISHFFLAIIRSSSFPLTTRNTFSFSLSLPPSFPSFVTLLFLEDLGAANHSWAEGAQARLFGIGLLKDDTPHIPWHSEIQPDRTELLILTQSSQDVPGLLWVSPKRGLQKGNNCFLCRIFLVGYSEIL